MKVFCIILVILSFSTAMAQERKLKSSQKIIRGASFAAPKTTDEALKTEGIETEKQEIPKQATVSEIRKNVFFLEGGGSIMMYNNFAKFTTPEIKLETGLKGGLYYQRRFFKHLAIEPFVSSTYTTREIKTASSKRPSISMLTGTAGMNIVLILPIEQFEFFIFGGGGYNYNKWTAKYGSYDTSKDGGSIGLQTGVGFDVLISETLMGGLKYEYHINKNEIDFGSGAKEKVDFTTSAVTLRIGIKF